VKVVEELIIDGFLSEDKELLMDEIMNQYGQEIYMVSSWLAILAWYLEFSH
jgi:hypothetical protein